MQKEDQIITMLEKIMTTQDEHSEKFDDHTRILREHSEKLDEHTRILGEHSEKLDEHTRILGEHSERHDIHDMKFEDHSQMLRSLLSGQEVLKAEFDGMKISNAKEFAAIREEMSNQSIKLELLRDDTWANKVDIHRMKNTMGMK